jgi:hypothetical protein
LKPSQIQVKQVVEVNWADRWQVYFRLQELGIPSWCEQNQPLTVEIVSVTSAIQLWSVSRQFKVSRQEMISTLKQCWDCDWKF